MHKSVDSAKCDSTAGKQGIEPTKGELLRLPRQQDLSYRLLPKGEDPVELPADQWIRDLAHGKQRQPIFHLVVDHRLVGRFGEAVCMYPRFVWAAQLLVRELVRRVPVGDPRQPRERDAEQP